MTMQHYIDIFRRNVRRNMDESKPQSFARKIDHQRPVLVPIAISANNRQRRADCFQVERDRRFANIAEMPDFVGIARQINNLLRQLVMRVRQYKYAQRVHIRAADGADNADIPSAPRKIIRLNPRNPRLALHHVI